LSQFSVARFQWRNGILSDPPTVRDVIAFPKATKGADLMTDSPATVEPKQLRDLHIELKVKKPEATPLKAT